MNETFLRGFPFPEGASRPFHACPCSFFGECEGEYLGWGDVFLFDHVCNLGCDGRGLACARACEDQLWGLGVLDGFKLAGF